MTTILYQAGDFYVRAVDDMEIELCRRIRIDTLPRSPLMVVDNPRYLTLAALLTRLRDRVCEKLGEPRAMTLCLFTDGTGSVTLGAKTFGAVWRPLEDAFAEVEDWLARDEDAELNATLGLTPDGKFANASDCNGQLPACDCGAPSDGRWADKHSPECASVKG